MQPTSDFTQDSNSKAEEPMSKTKEKRDQFLTEIRKKKNQDAINQKRLKFSTNDSQVSENPFMLFHMAGMSNLQNQTMNQGQYGSQLETQLKMSYDKFCEGYNTENWEDVLMVVQALRLATGEQNSGVTPRMVIEMGIVPNVLSLLDERLSAVSKLQSEACWLIANITAGDINDTLYLIEQHSIQILTSCIRNKPQDLQENAIWALANIATESFTDFRNAILDAGALREVVKEICGPQKRPSYVRIVAWFLKSLLRTPSPEFDKVSISITVLAQFIVYPDEEIQKIAVQSLYFFSMLNDNAKHYVIYAHKLIPKIVSFIESQDLDTKFYALKTAGNLSNADKKITMELCSSGILQFLPNCLECQEQEIRREACYTLSNILADKVEGHDSVLDNKILPLLLNIVQYDNPEMRFEATVCIFNFVLKCSQSEAQMLVSQNILELLLGNLMEDHVKLLRATLDTLYHVLVKGDSMRENYDGMNPYVYRVASSNGVHLIENLQHKTDQQIYDKVNKLMDDFFQTENINTGF